MRAIQTTAELADELNIVSSVWILSCNDSYALMTYEEVRYRLGLPDDYDLKGIIRKRGALFRAGVASRRLEELKQEMLAGKNLPDWLKGVVDENERKKRITSLTPDDFFSNQFRIDPDQPIVSDEIVRWGLETIDKLRKARTDAREERRKSWSTITIPLITMGITLILGLTNYFILRLSFEQQGWFQVLQSQNQARSIAVQGFASELKAKQEAYARFMTSLTNASGSVEARDRMALIAALSSAEAAYYEIEPFLEIRQSEALLDRYLSFSKLCRQASSAEGPPVGFSDKATDYRKSFVADLHQALFSDRY
jgi:hypothetical protein